MLNSISRILASRYIYISILVGIVVLFIFGFLPSGTGWVIIKTIFFLALLSLAYLHFQSTQESEEDGDFEESVPELQEGQQKWFRMETDQGVEAVFETFLQHNLHLIKKVLVSDSIVLLFANYSKKQLTIRYFVSDNESKFIQGKSFDILKGLPSLILRNRTPLIENHLPQGNEILPYYQSAENPSISFAGVPVYFNDLIIGVLCADTGVEGAYSNEDLDILKNFANLIAVQIANSNKLYEYETENWVVNLLLETSREMNEIVSVDALWHYLTGKIPGVVSCDRISISRKQNEQEAEIVAIEGGTGNLKPGMNLSLSEGIVGWVMRKNQSLLVEDFSSKENYVPRFAAKETPAKDLFSLLAVPMANKKEVIGVICVESYQPGNFKDQHKRILQTIANQATTVYLNARTVDNLKLLNFKNTQSNLENLNAFRFLLPKEIKRGKKFNLSLNLLFLKVYFQTKEDDYRLHQEAIREFLNLLLPDLPETDYIFHLYPDTFAITTVEQEGYKIQTLAERLIQKVNQKKVWGNGQVFDFYVSLGLVPGEFMTSDVDEIVERGLSAVKRARLKGPNQTAVYSNSDSNTAFIKRE